MPFTLGTEFLEPLDIVNRACDHLGITHVASVAEQSVASQKLFPIYDKVRRAELRRNDWRFSIRKCLLRPVDTTTYLLAPALWNAGIQYLPGSIVSDSNGLLWLSNQANNLGNQPGESDVWDSYFGQMTVDAYDTTGETSYFAGDLVYIANSNGSYVVYMSLVNTNTEVPNTADAWSATTTYQQDQVVSYGGSQWRSLIALNLNNTPATGPANWVSTQTYSTSNQVTASDGFIYTAVGSSTGVNPVSDNGTYWTNTNTPNAWTSSPVLPVSSSLWVPIYAAIKSLNILYPIGAGPLSQAFNKNVFHLPAGYLRPVVSDPKAGVNPFLGAPNGRDRSDWEYEGDFIMSMQATPILFRFVANIQDVTKMDDMFCEGMACRMAVEACEALTNSNTKQQTIDNAYQKFMGEARIVNAVEIGPVEPPEDDYVTCRY